MGTDDDRPDTEPTRADQPTAAEQPQARAQRTTGTWSALDGGHFRLGEKLGRGGMGEVVVAHDTVMGREVAIKRLLSLQPAADDEARFMREAQVQGRLDHPSIPPVYELGRDHQGRPYIVMKRLSGTTLAETLNKVETGALPYARERLLRAFIDVCLAIELAHTRGVIHRDLKPANIMLGEFGEVYVLDWGAAKVIGDTSSERVRVPTPRPETDGEHTQDGTVIGTPLYMAPEQRDASRDLDGRADVYALGRLLCEILAARRLRAPVRTEQDRRPSFHARDREVPPELDDLCVAATAPRREDRVGSARELADRVQRYLDGDRDLALRKTLAAQHLQSARTLYDRDDTRADALREAGRALALDPTLAPAADLVGRLMLERPSTLPPEVERTLAEVDLQDIQRTARVGVTAYLAYLAFVPAMLVLGVRSPGYPVAVVALALALSVAAWFGVRRPLARWRVPALLVGNALVVAVFSRMFTPFMVAPGIAAVTALVLFRSPAFRGRWMVPTVIVLSLGVAVPWLGEQVGWFAPTHRVVDGALVLRSPAVDMSQVGLGIGIIFYCLAITTVAALISRVHTRGHRAAEQQLHLQAWRLRQLVPQSGQVL
jgi:serine/threonine-protein kinase